MKKYDIIIWRERAERSSMLNLPENTKSIHMFDEKLSFPVFIYVTNEWERTQVDYLNENYNNARFTTLALCQWCENHKLRYQIIYFENPRKLFLKDFKRFLCYLYIKYKGY